MIVVDNLVPNKEKKCTLQEWFDGEISKEDKNQNKLPKTKNLLVLFQKLMTDYTQNCSMLGIKTLFWKKLILSISKPRQLLKTLKPFS